MCSRGEEMNTRQLALNMAAVMIAIIVAAGTLQAENNIPQTAIDHILAYQTGLSLTETQIVKLTKFNSGIIDDLIQVRGQIEIRRMAIDEIDSDWSNIQTLSIIQMIDEYYDYLAKYKQLELEAIMKARGVLTRNQMLNYSNMVSVEAMIIELEGGYSSAY
jgi:hypothetical protein